MKEYRHARNIAEQIYFCGKRRLTTEQKEMLRNSPFSNLLEMVEKPNFIKLAETIEKQLTDAKPEKPKSSPDYSPSKSRYLTGYHTGEIKELISHIEDHFKLGVPYNYNDLPADKLKEFISQYAEHKIFDDHTKDLVLRVKEQEHPEEIMGTLRLYARH
jgi:hypothetical protein